MQRGQKHTETISPYVVCFKLPRSGHTCTAAGDVEKGEKFFSSFIRIIEAPQLLLSLSLLL
jgi:hypothetical protein